MAEILDVPVTELLNLPNIEKENNQAVAQDDTDAVAMTEEEYLYYEKRRREHLLLLVVQGIGAALGLLAVVSSDYGFLKMLTGFLVMPLACAGLLRFFVRTFRIVRMKLGRRVYDGAGSYYTVPNNGLGVIGCFVAFGLFTCVLTGVAHIEHAAEIIMLMLGIIEVFLLYTDIKIVRTAGCGRASLNIVIVFAVVIVVLSAIIVFLWFSAKDDIEVNADVPETVAPTEYQPLYVTDFSQVASELEYVCEKAHAYVLAEEYEARESNYEIVIPSSLQAAYFLTETSSESNYYDFGTGTLVHNAILLVCHYNVNIANTSPRDEWVICVFPNFVINADGTPSYDENNEYREYLQADNLEKVYTWMEKEYERMSIVPLEVPLS